jgi:protein PhnA
MSLPACPECRENLTYEDGALYVCPICFHEWSEASQRDEARAMAVRDANGNELREGDDVTVVRDLKMGKEVIKQGTRVRGIKLLTDPVDGHDIQARVEGFGVVYLKSSVVKK